MRAFLSAFQIIAIIIKSSIVLGGSVSSSLVAPEFLCKPVKMECYI